jgi:diguanylate cyclase (GGDEF)-like protein
VNDVHGHAVGDAVLRIAAQRLASVIRPGDVLGRFGGDEFVVFLPGADVDAAMLVADRMQDALASPIDVDGVRAALGISIGVNGLPSASLDEQLSTADAALYRAKHAGGGRVEVA